MTTNDNNFVPLRFKRRPAAQMREDAADFEAMMQTRRSVRHFSNEPVPQALIASAIRTASSAPSGAHMQPWHFSCVSSPSVKKQIREAAEKEERESYDGRMSEEWRKALEPLGTNADKPYLETVPWIVVLFEQPYGFDEHGNKRKHYYVKESVGLAAGLFIAAIHRMGLATLTHTPSPMGFLRDILGRPAHERPFVLFPVGYPTSDAVVPDLTRKSLDQVSSWHTTT